MFRFFQDAETALAHDKTNIRAIYQKAEALYFLGQFELSLMFFHRGLRLRPELTSFRLGVQKTQEAIEKTIGSFEKCPTATATASTTAPGITKKMSISHIPSTKQSKSHPQSGTRSQNDLNPFTMAAKSAKKVLQQRPKTGAANTTEKREARKLLGELYVDKEYLENLLKHPNLKRADTATEHISKLANDAVQFLNTRQEFWRQQRPCTALPKKKLVPE